MKPVRAAVGVLAAGTGVLGWRLHRVLRGAAEAPSYWSRRSRSPGALRYVALGDSLAVGIGASRPERGYVGVLATSLAGATGRGVQVVNLGVTGATVADVRRVQLPALAALDPDLVTLCVGANDAGRTPVAQFAAEFDAVCAALPPGALVGDVPDFQGGPRVAPAQVLSAAAREVLTRHPSLVPVPIEEATHRMPWYEYGGDFFHPGNRGYRRYAAAFQAALVAGPPHLGGQLHRT